MQVLEIVQSCSGMDPKGSLFPLDSIIFQWKPTGDDATVAKVILDFSS